MSRVGIVGTGYVGLTTGAVLAHLGHSVVCADVVPEKVESLRRGEVTILEDSLEDLVREGIDGGRLSFVLGAEAAARDAEFVFLCVQTPQGHDGAADLTFIENAAREIAPVLASDAVVVNKSTVPVGSTRVVQQALGRSDVAVVSNPEFLREGFAVHDSFHPDRIVVGADDQAAAVRVAELFDDVQSPLIVTDPASAEMIKYAANAYLATKVSYVNAIANLCEAVGADMREVALGMGYDKRIGFEFMRPGPGYGGSCLPKDTKALVRMADDAGYAFGLLEGVIGVNEEQFERMVAKVHRALEGEFAGRTVAAWGLTFKARTNDLRDSPALEVARRLRQRGAAVCAYDPTVRAAIEGFDIEVVDDPYAACEGADVLVVLTEWDEFRWVDFDKVREALAHPRVVDCRNLLDPAALRRRGFSYEGVGRI